MDEILVVDIGGTKTTVSFVEQNASGINITYSEKFHTTSNPEQTIQRIIDIFNSNNKKINYISLSVPGDWDSSGVLKESYFLHGWLEFPFVQKLLHGLSLENYVIESDVVCGALGEHYILGDSFKKDSLLYINLGTGVGAAFIKDEAPFKSKSKLTLRVQKLVLPFQDELYSGVDLISGGSLSSIFKCDSVEALFKSYKDADIEAIDIISKAQMQLAAWIINLFYLFAPDVIVLNGGLTYDWEVLVGEAVDIANDELQGQVKIFPSKLKDLAPIYGAYVNFCQQVKMPVN